jgi:hypothetical protein
VAAQQYLVVCSADRFSQRIETLDARFGFRGGRSTNNC